MINALFLMNRLLQGVAFLPFIPFPIYLINHVGFRGMGGPFLFAQFFISGGGATVITMSFSRRKA